MTSKRENQKAKSARRAQRLRQLVTSKKPTAARVDAAKDQLGRLPRILTSVSCAGSTRTLWRDNAHNALRRTERGKHAGNGLDWLRLLPRALPEHSANAAPMSGPMTPAMA
jgi:hypothetical protein